MIGYYGDLHLREKGSFTPYHRLSNRGLTYEIENQLTAADFLCREIERNNLEALFFLGDMFDDLNFISKRTMYACGLFLDKVSATCKKVGTKAYFVPGNHDTGLEVDGTLINYLKPLVGYGEIIEDITEVTTSDGLVISMMPFTKNSQKISDWLEHAKDVDVLVTHLEFDGFSMDNGYPCLSGIKPVHRTPIVSGHLHKRQLNDIIDIYYPGSIIQNKFQMRDLSSTGGILLSEGKKFHFIENDLSKHYVKVDDLNQLRHLNKDKCLLNIVLEYDLKDIKDQLEGFEYMYHKRRIVDDVKRSVANATYIDPKTLFQERMRQMGDDYVTESQEVLG